MELKDLQRLVHRHFSSMGRKRNIEQRMLTLFEEVGELSESLLIEQGCKTEKRSSFEEELADVLMNALELAEMRAVNLQLEVLKKTSRRG